MSRFAVGRAGGVAGTLGLGGGLLAVAATPWLSVAVTTALTTANVTVRGSEAVPAVPAAALVLLAGGLALALAGPVARLVAALAVIGAGAVVAAVTAGFIADPSAAAASAAAAATGVRGVAADVTATAWPAVALGLGVVGVVGGVVVAVAQRSWGRGGPGRRYERVTPAVAAPIAADGAGISHGVTDGAGVSDGAGVTDGAGVADGVRDARVRAMDDWDALTRGEDPT